MVDGVAQHVLQRCGHALQDIAVHLALGIADNELDVLAQLAGDLPHDALEAWQHALERHHARAHQAFLQLGVDPPLLLQQVLGVLVATLEGFLEVEQIGGGLEQRPRQLLQLRVAVHFQRIELFVAQPLGLDLLPTENPPLGFGIQASQLIAHALEGGFNLAQCHSGIVDLLFDTPAKDRGLPGQVHQVVEQLGGHLDHVGAGLRLRHGRLGLAHRHRLAPLRRVLARDRVTEALDGLDQAIGRLHRLTGTGGVEHLCQSIMTALQQPEQLGSGLQQAGRQAFV
ncbi:hypothetical protein D3C78_794780 [compost metagenome]